MLLLLHFHDAARSQSPQLQQQTAAAGWLLNNSRFMLLPSSVSFTIKVMHK